MKKTCKSIGYIFAFLALYNRQEPNQSTMHHYTDEELLDGFRKEILSKHQKEAFLERAAKDKGFVHKFIEMLEALAT